MLSLLLGSHPPALPVRDLVRIAELFGISDTALRVALTRMVASGDLQRTDRTYELSARLLERQRRQDEAVSPRVREWDGGWELVAVTAGGRGATARAALRVRLAGLRLAELREGLWLRPANLRRPLPADLDEVAARFDGTPQGDPADLVRSLWDLQEWAERAAELTDRLAAAEGPAERFTLAAASVRHLLADPVLPEVLLPPAWPAEALRVAFRDYRREVADIIVSAQDTLD
ncbi:PaaX family transcriptional regulator C-terminal domain-containing protein [Streptomyces tardus]|uniref:PaaX family transcriptional regulator C-terminal domain-containing protein n=1 Tax=Streptomyces tardus TaxID=2780544 RepID=UPI0027E4F9E1|nr:PaaX family transcriptional regulator C-terminal domain-containing protein [Streptomyces tardus]